MFEQIKIEKIKKRKEHAFRKDIYLLGERKEDGKLVWLEAPSWDCGWYWGFGYLETYTNNQNPQFAKDIYSHSHFDGDILNGNGCSFDNFKNYFNKTTLTDKEIWKLCDYMITFYTLKKAAALFGAGNSHQTEDAKIETLQDKEISDIINQKKLPELFKNIIELLKPSEEVEQ